MGVSTKTNREPASRLPAHAQQQSTLFELSVICLLRQAVCVPACNIGLLILPFQVCYCKFLRVRV